MWKQGLKPGAQITDPGWISPTPLRKAAITEKRALAEGHRQRFRGRHPRRRADPRPPICAEPDPTSSTRRRQNNVMLPMKQGAAGYSHGFNVVEEGQQIRSDITAVMVAPKCPAPKGVKVQARGFGVPTLIAVHPENDPQGEGAAIAKAWPLLPVATVPACWNLPSSRK